MTSSFQMLVYSPFVPDATYTVHSSYCICREEEPQDAVRFSETFLATNKLYGAVIQMIRVRRTLAGSTPRSSHRWWVIALDQAGCTRVYHRLHTARNKIHRELKTKIRCLYAKAKE
jgi:hypothetical protein